MQITASNGAFPEVPVNSHPPEQQQQNREIIQAVKALNATAFLGQDNELTFLMDRGTRRPIIRIVNRKTREVVRQIPAEYLLQMAESSR